MDEAESRSGNVKVLGANVKDLGAVERRGKKENMNVNNKSQANRMICPTQ